MYCFRCPLIVLLVSLVCYFVQLHLNPGEMKTVFLNGFVTCSAITRKCLVEIVANFVNYQTRVLIFSCEGPNVNNHGLIVIFTIVFIPFYFSFRAASHFWRRPFFIGRYTNQTVMPTEVTRCRYYIDGLDMVLFWNIFLNCMPGRMWR